MLKKLLTAGALLFALMGGAFAQASYTALDSTGATQTFKSINCSALICPLTVLTDSTGAPLSATNGTFANILQGNAVLSLTNPSFASISDGTTKAPVKAASTAAATTDPALVVAISPNNTIPVKVASGQVASGAYASGSIASGAYASGSIGAGSVAAGAYVSGSVLSGAYASGALVDITNVSAPVAFNTATATKSILYGMQFLTTQPTLSVNTQQGAMLASTRGELLVAPGVSGFPVTLSGSQSVNVAQVLGSAISATNGLFTNVLQGNAVLSQTNPSFESITDGTTKASVTATPADGTTNTGVNGLNVVAYQKCYNGTTWDRCTQIGTGTPGTPNTTTVLSVQGEASMTPLAGNITQVLGSAISATNPLFSSITDGTNKAAVKPASTAAAATDPALVVTVSPNGLNANGQATMANSAPVVIASNQSNLAVIGPTADGTAAATAPVLVAGTVDGTGTGAVAIQKITAGGIASTDMSSVNGTALGTPTNFGTTPGAVISQQVNASLFVGTVVASSGNGVSGTGTQRVNIASDNTAFPVNAAATATEVHSGEVGGNMIPITNAITTTAVTYTTGQAIGALQTLAAAVRVSAALGASGTSAILQSVILSITDAVTVPNAADIFFFNANPSGSTCTNAAAFVLAAADRAKVIGIAHMTDFTSGNTAVIGQALNLAMPYGLASATSLFACVVARGSFVVAGTTDASLLINTLRN